VVAGESRRELFEEMEKEYIGKGVDLVYDAGNTCIYHGLKLVTIDQRDDSP